MSGAYRDRARPPGRGAEPGIPRRSPRGRSRRARGHVARPGRVGPGREGGRRGAGPVRSRGAARRPHLRRARRRRRAAGTGLSGGANAVSGCVVLDLSRMNQVLEIDPDNLVCLVQPGAVNNDVKAAVAEHGLWYPPDPASAPWSTIGGNVATNAGGLCCLKYGVTRDYVLGLRAVVGGPVAYGDVVRFGRRTTKGVAGLDMVGLFVGSEGTLGVVTEVTLRLRPAPAGTPRTVVGAFP